MSGWCVCVKVPDFISLNTPSNVIYVPDSDLIETASFVSKLFKQIQIHIY